MAFGLPKVGDLQAALNDKFDQLISKLDEILAELKRQGAQPNG